MWKLIIADDERVIRETIYHLIDWESLDIEVVGLCKDGIEAYNMILDESPDIVMTDIRMPGLSGLELVREIVQTDRQIQFLILSGYEEFEYAREAMKWGVKHYLLKPCNEEKLVESILQACEDCRKAKARAESEKRQNAMQNVIHQDAMYHLIMDGITVREEWEDSTSEESLSAFQEAEEQMELYGQYLDLGKHTCYLVYLYFLEQTELEHVLEQLEQYGKETGRDLLFYGLYVKNTLLLFSHELPDKVVLRNCLRQSASMVEIKTEQYESLPELLKTVLFKVRRYDVLYAIHNFKPIAILNNQNSIRYLQKIYAELEGNDPAENERCVEELTTMVRGASRRDFLQMLGNSICTHMAKIGAYSMQEEAAFLRISNEEKETETLRTLILEMLSQAKKKLCREDQEYGILVERIMEYVKEHLADDDLTLKKIAESYLYMNVDYVSRKFHQITEKKFSQYLTEQRVERAKELFLKDPGNKVQYVAEQVGCGNNPQYFTQIFKKAEGMTPAKWAAKMSEK